MRLRSRFFRAGAVWALCLALCCLGHDNLSGNELQRVSPEKGQADPESGQVWYDARHLTMEGQGYLPDTLAAPFDRLPAKAEKLVPPAVWGLSHHAAGIAVYFVTDSPTIHGRWTLTASRLEMPHMPATGVSGIDLYVKDQGKWRWLAIGQPKAQTNSVALVSGLPQAQREYLLYLPLYNGVTKLEVGIDKGTEISRPAARPAERQKPIVFYGTSITQGGCASRPGMVHTAILGRRLNYPVINLGFSGNGKMEAALAELLGEIDAAVYVIDCLPNMTDSMINERAIPFVKKLRELQPETPILLVEDRSFANSFLIAGSRQRNETNRAALRKGYETLLQEGVQKLGYLEGKHLLGEDGEDTVDASHPTDLGFLRQADAFEPALQQLLPASANSARANSARQP